MSTSCRDLHAPLSTTSHAILGLLSLRSWTTYELAKQVQRSLGWFWPRAERKLYDEPKRLVAAGLASSEREMTGARPRTVYAVTRRGPERAAALARRAAGAADARVRGHGQGVLRRRRHARTAAGDAHVDRRDRRRRAWSSSRARSTS